jgi:hypothetical protein
MRRVDDGYPKRLVFSLIHYSLCRKQSELENVEPRIHATLSGSRCRGCVSDGIGPIADLLITAKREGAIFLGASHHRSNG